MPASAARVDRASQAGCPNRRVASSASVMDPYAWQHGASREIVHGGDRLTLGARKLAQGERDYGWGQGQQHRGQGERRSGGAEQLPSYPTQWLAGSQKPVNPLDRVGGTRGEGRYGTGGCGQDDQGGGEQPRIAGTGGRIVGVEFHQARYLLFGVPHQGQEREHLAADPRHGYHPVMAAGQVGSLVRQDRIQLAGIERLHGAGG